MSRGTKEIEMFDKRAWNPTFPVMKVTVFMLRSDSCDPVGLISVKNQGQLPVTAKGNTHGFSWLTYDLIDEVPLFWNCESTVCQLFKFI